MRGLGRAQISVREGFEAQITSTDEVAERVVDVVQQQPSIDHLNENARCGGTDLLYCEAPLFPSPNYTR